MTNENAEPYRQMQLDKVGDDDSPQAQPQELETEAGRPMMLDAAIPPSKVPEVLRRNHRRTFMGSLNEQELDAIIEDTMLYLEAGIKGGDDGEREG